MPFLGPALGWTAMCSPGWGNLVAIDWNDLPVGREFDGKFLKNVKSPPHALPPPAAGLTLIGALVDTISRTFLKQKKQFLAGQNSSNFLGDTSYKFRVVN